MAETGTSAARDYPDRPLVGVGVVVWRGDKFLLIRRGKQPRMGQLSLPGGAQEVGETVHQAARREIAEETSLDIEVLGLVDVVDSIQRDDDGRVRFHYTLVDVAAEVVGGEAKAGSDAAAVEWYCLVDLPGLNLWAETERIIRESAKLRHAAAVPAK